MSGGFESLGIMPEIIQAVTELNWKLPTDIQDEAIPLILGGGDVMAAAETGSGKTAAFCIPIIQCVHEKLRDKKSSQLKIENNEKLILSSSTSSSTSLSTSLNSKIINLNEDDKDAEIILSEDRLTCSSNIKKVWQGVRANHGVTNGKVYFECTVQGNGLCRVGWSTKSAQLELGTDAYGFGYGGSGFKVTNGAFKPYGGKFTNGDCIGVFIDIDKKVIAYSKNGVDLGVAFTIPDDIIGSELFPTFTIQNAGVQVYFGQSPMKYSPDGYQNLHDSLQEKSSMISNDTSVLPTATSYGARKPSAIIIEPTKELAEQVYQSFQDLSRHVIDPEITSQLFIGGTYNKAQSRRIKEEGMDIVIGTVGKLLAMIKANELDLSQIQFFILDEADQLCESDNLTSVLEIFSYCPTVGTGSNRLQVCFFSATLHSFPVRNLSNKICYHPIWIDLKGIDSVPETVHHVIYRIHPTDDLHYKINGQYPAITDEVHLLKELNQFESIQSQLIKEIKPHVALQLIQKYQMSQCIIFCRTNLDCFNLESFFNQYNQIKKSSTQPVESGKQANYSCCVLGGMLSVKERRENLEAFKDGLVRLLICTDVAARGIDVDGLPYVINMTLPDKAEDYIHRIGRVGRADKMGLAISIAATDGLKEKVWYHQCNSKGKGCQNRNLKEKGGCTIWYDETSLVEAIEERLHQKLFLLTKDLSLPDELANQNIKYGEDTKVKDDTSTTVFAYHFKDLESDVKDLASMEKQAQNLFLMMRYQEIRR